MTRQSAQSIEELVERHKCAEVLNDPSSKVDREPYEVVAITGTGLVSSTLSATLPSIRAFYEIVDIYVRVIGEYTVFEPLHVEHLPMEGSWVVIARRRHPSNEPRIVGMMLAKDEGDIIPDVIASLAGSLDTLYYFAGDQATADAIVASAPNAGWARAIADPRLPHSDGLRHFLLEASRKDAMTDNDPRPMWVMSTQGDEVYHDNLRHHVMLAQAERATVFTAQVATFLLHESQQDDWDWSQPLETRLTHYIWDFGEHAGFLDFPWIYYTPGEHMRAHPHGLYPAVWAKARPVRKHYPFRSPKQAQARIEDRLKSTAAHPHGWQPHYSNYRDIFMSDRAAEREVKRYFGWFPEAERTEGVW